MQSNNNNHLNLNPNTNAGVKYIFALSWVIVGIILSGMILPLKSQSQKQNQPDSKTQDLPEWKELTTSEMKSGLKKYAYAKIRMSMRKEIVYDLTKEIFYSPCPPPFPNLPGDFPCNLLEYSEDTKLPDPSVLEYKEGGMVNVYLSSRKSPLLGGVTLLLSSVQDPDKENSPDTKKDKVKKRSGEDLQIFYNPDHTISHYRVAENVILFSWKKEKGSPTLKKMMHVRMDKDLWPVKAKEIDFSR